MGQRIDPEHERDEGMLELEEEYKLFLLTEEKGTVRSEAKDDNLDNDLDAAKVVPGEYHVSVSQKVGEAGMSRSDCRKLEFWVTRHTPTS